MWNLIAAHISRVTGQPFQVKHQRSLGGGCINAAAALSDGHQTYFVKLNQATQVAMFEAEAAGLEEMVATQTIRVPKPVCWGTVQNSAYLVLEWLELGGHGGANAWAEMGRNLATMHRATNSNGFGWKLDNTIGSTPQPNPWTTDWMTFWQNHRIGFQFQLANRRGGFFPNQERLLHAIPHLLDGHHPQPSLVHGDLWSGNAAITRSGEPVIFDPATYYGDREVDLAMTELFGSFPADFYHAYKAAYPLSTGYQQRKVLYNLYHILNHFNLFGGGYDAQANRMIDQILSWV
jgi:fructosamine-3-kinase